MADRIHKAIRSVLTIAVSAPLLALMASTHAHANPVESPFDQMFSWYWLVRTLPFNYAVDLIALCLALLLFRQRQRIAWRMAPVYNLLVMTAGYLSDWLGRTISGYPDYGLISGNTVFGRLMDPSAAELGDFTFRAGVAFIVAVSALIYLCNLAIIRLILHLNDIEPQGTLYLSAAVMAVVTSPYISLKGDAKAACFVPILLVCLALVGHYAAGRFIRRGKRTMGVRCLRTPRPTGL